MAGGGPLLDGEEEVATVAGPFEWIPPSALPKALLPSTSGKKYPKTEKAMRSRWRINTRQVVSSGCRELRMARSRPEPPLNPHFQMMNPHFRRQVDNVDMTRRFDAMHDLEVVRAREDKIVVRFHLRPEVFRSRHFDGPRLEMVLLRNGAMARLLCAAPTPLP